MTDIINLQDPLPELHDAVVIVAFSELRRAGRLPARTLSYLTEAWNAERLARTDLEDIYDLTVHRPEGHYEEDRRILDWPQVHIFHARPGTAADRDILFLLGGEPNFRWRTLAAQLAEYLNGLGVKTLVCLRAFPGDVPHTRPAPVLLNGTDAELAGRFGAMPSGAKYEGVTDFGSVLSARAQALGLTTVDLSVQQPYYFPRMPNMAASIALIAALDRAYGTTTPVESLRKTADDQHAVLNSEMEHSEDFRSEVRGLEERYDSSHSTSDPRRSGVAEELPSAGELISGIEELFRKRTENPGSE